MKRDLADIVETQVAKLRAAVDVGLKAVLAAGTCVLLW